MRVDVWVVARDESRNTPVIDLVSEAAPCSNRSDRSQAGEPVSTGPSLMFTLSIPPVNANGNL